MEHVDRKMSESNVDPAASIYWAVFQACANMETVSPEVVSSVLDEALQLLDGSDYRRKIDDRLWGE